MATKAKAKPARRAKQPYLSAEMTPPSHKDIDQAADYYCEVHLAHSNYGAKKKDAMRELVATMDKYGIEHYRTPDGLVVTVTRKGQAKVKKQKRSVESNGDE